MRERLAFLLVGLIVGAALGWLLFGRGYAERVTDDASCRGVNGYVGASADARQVWLCTEDGKLHTLSR